MILKKLMLFSLLTIFFLTLYGFFPGMYGPTSLRFLAAESVAKSILEGERDPSELTKLPAEIKDFVNFLIKYRLDLNTALLEAAKFNSTYVQDILSGQAHANTRDNLGGNTPLIWAAHNNLVNAIDPLIANGARINDTNDLGFSPLAFAAQQGNIESVAKLLSYDNVNLLALGTFRAGDNITPLMLASKNNFFEIVKLLLDKDTNLQLRDKDLSGNNALFYAIDGYSINIVKYLLNNYKNKININETNNNGQTALFVAAKKGSTKLTKLLIENGANVNHVNNEGSTPLHAAVFNRTSNPALIDFLIDKGANINAQTNDGYTPLFYAVIMGKVNDVKTLLKHGANATLTNNSGETPLMYTQGSGNTAIIRLLEAATKQEEEGEKEPIL